MIKVREYEGVKIIRMGRTIAGKVLYPVHCFYYQGTLIDTGCYSCQREFSQLMGEYPVERVVLTHAHEDHCGNVWFFNRKNIPVYMDAEGIPYVRAPQRLKMELYRKITWATPPAGEVEALLGEVLLGDIHLKAISTPGHSPEHLCFFEPDRRYLFAGDLFLGSRQRLLMRGERFWESLKSLKTVLALKPDVLFCSFNGALEGAAEKLQEKILYWEETAEKVLRLSEEGLTPEEIDRRLFTGRSLISIVSGGSFSTLNLINSILTRD